MAEVLQHRGSCRTVVGDWSERRAPGDMAISLLYSASVPMRTEAAVRRLGRRPGDSRRIARPPTQPCNHTRSARNPREVVPYEHSCHKASSGTAPRELLVLRLSTQIDPPRQSAEEVATFIVMCRGSLADLRVRPARSGVAFVGHRRRVGRTHPGPSVWCGGQRVRAHACVCANDARDTYDLTHAYACAGGGPSRHNGDGAGDAGGGTGRHQPSARTGRTTRRSWPRQSSRTSRGSGSPRRRRVRRAARVRLGAGRVLGRSAGVCVAGPTVRLRMLRRLRPYPAPRHPQPARPRAVGSRR